MIREANEGDFEAVAWLLRQQDMQVDGLLTWGSKYWVAEEQGNVIGAVGLELGNAAVLLRSAIVCPQWRGHGIGRELSCTALGWAQQAGYERAYCFSAEAGSYWVRLGFEHCPVEEVKGALPEAPQVRLFWNLGWLTDEVCYRARLA